MKQTFILSTILFFSLTLGAQRENAQWYFGNQASIDFNTGVPVSGAESEMSVPEACSSIADADGNLLFYTNGETIWNKVNEVMQNGTGIGAGPSNWFTSVLIVPDPANTNRYYLFTNKNGGDFLYTIIDMSMDEGLGAVPEGEKNQFVVPGLLDGKFTAIRHANGKDIWLVMHSLGNAVLSFLITDGGIQDPVVTEEAFDFWNYTYGPVVASPDGSQIVIAPDDGFDGWEEYLVLVFLDFDRATGLVSNPREIYEFNESSHGIAFSEDGKKLYRTRFGNSVIYQYDLTAENIGASRTVVSTVPAEYGNIRLGPDCKIYIAVNNEQYLSVIPNPNELGTACGFESQGVMLDGFSKFGLPDNPKSLYPDAPCLEIVSSQISLDNKLNFVIFPNPSNQMCWMSIKVPSGQGYTVQIMDLNGKVLFETKGIGKETLKQIEISNLLDVPRGVYIGKLTSNNQFITQKIILQ